MWPVKRGALRVYLGAAPGDNLERRPTPTSIDRRTAGCQFTLRWSAWSGRECDGVGDHVLESGPRAYSELSTERETIGGGGHRWTGRRDRSGRAIGERDDRS